MTLYELQKRVYENKVRRGFNVTDVGKEVVLMSEEFGEFCDAYLEDDKEEIVDAFGDLMIYCLGLSAMFDWNAGEIMNREPSFKKHPQSAGDYLPYIGREVGRIAKAYKKSNKEPVQSIDRRDDFKTHIGNLMGYCMYAFEGIAVLPLATLEHIIQNNEVRTHEGQI
ncbi:hypothetical protein KY349_01425 [Candidatus Woesearchaeota archaeon]|nr:hypothetical protein [Candidatus Woesearchaeota archaeon]